MTPSSSLPLPFDSQPERALYTVSRLNREVRQLLERGIAALWIEGEVSNFSQPASGHWYFSLKDKNSHVRCVMWRTAQLGLGFTPRNGQAVVARARVSLYEPKGEYQLVVERLEETGLGARKRDFDRLKEKLQAEGMFAAERKRELPRMPSRIGIVTSPTGAALRDILHVLARRFPPARVLIYPTPVQGPGAAPRIVEALAVASARRECDVLILARGGGSIEDLWAFNDERVARAIVACAIPVVTGVGHETDFTIADFAADARAPTPSAAAERVVPEREACLQALARTVQRLRVAIGRELRTVDARFAAAAARLKVSDPGARLAQQQQRLDDLAQHLHGAMRAQLHDCGTRLGEVLAELTYRSPAARVQDMHARHAVLAGRLRHAFDGRLAASEHRLGLALRGLESVSPLATLARGFAIVTRAADGELVTRTEQLSSGDEIDARLAHGRVRARVTDVER
jgi:exodeoxyribonuclease VII large subunit